MDFADFIKKNLVVIIALVVTILATGWLGWKVSQSHAALKESESRVQDVVETQRRLTNIPFALTKTNAEVAAQNAEKAKAQVENLRGLLSQEFRVLDYKDLHAIDMKRILLAKCQKFRDQLADVQTSIRWFTFGKFAEGDKLPSTGEIRRLQKQLDIVEEFVAKIERAQLKELQQLSREGGESLEMTDKDFYSHVRYNLKVSGNIEQIRTFINEISTSRFCFIVQRVALMAPRDMTQNLIYPLAPAVEGAAPESNPDAAMMIGPEGMMDPGMNPYDAGLPPGARPPNPGTRRTTNRRAATPPATETPAAPVARRELTRAERIVFDELATLTAEITIDYVEFK